MDILVSVDVSARVQPFLHRSRVAGLRGHNYLLGSHLKSRALAYRRRRRAIADPVKSELSTRSRAACATCICQFEENLSLFRESKVSSSKLSAAKSEAKAAKKLATVRH